MLRMCNITKTFNSGTVDERVALDHMDLTLQDGDFVTVIGGNGAGKSTMQNAICGTWQPDEGSIELDGVNVSGMPEYKRARYLGRVYQDPMMGTSAGIQQPKLLLLDEHTAALDPQTAARVMELTDRLVQENHLTTLMITHNMRDAIRYGNRLLMLHNGRIVLDISGEEKSRLTVADLMDMFRKVSGREYDNDRTLLA